MCNPIELFTEVLQEFDDDSKWDGAVLGKIKTISNTKVGGVGQLFIERLCNQLSIPWSFPANAKGERLTQSPWDIEILNIKFELKTATEDINGKFQFNHIRYHRTYEGLLCLGVSPTNLHFGVWSKADVTTNKAGRLVSMEKSANASYKLTKDPKHLYEITDFYSEITKFSNNFNK
jgi:hypothetical protein